MLGLSLSCYFFCVTSGLIWTAHNYVVKIDSANCCSCQHMVLPVQLPAQQCQSWDCVKLVPPGLPLVSPQLQHVADLTTEAPDSSDCMPPIAASMHITRLFTPHFHHLLELFRYKTIFPALCFFRLCRLQAVLLRGDEGNQRNSAPAV